MEGIHFGESVRFHDGHVWFADWAAHRIIEVHDLGHRVVVEVDSFPLCFDFQPDGRALIVNSTEQLLMRLEPDGTLSVQADLSVVTTKPWNDIVVAENGNAYVNTINFDFPGGEPVPGLVALVRTDGVVSVVGRDLWFPNGMAITEDGLTLIVAESYGNCLTAFEIGSDGTLENRRVWAPTPGDHPDGICIDSEGAVWYADVGNKHCVRVCEGGEVLDTIEIDRGAFDCALSRRGDPKLFVVGQQYGGPAGDRPTGILFEFPAPSPGVGRP